MIPNVFISDPGNSYASNPASNIGIMKAFQCSRPVYPDRTGFNITMDCKAIEKIRLVLILNVNNIS